MQPKQTRASARRPKAAAGKARALAGPPRLLVVEDHADTRKGLMMFLKMLGWEAEFAADLQTALAAGIRQDFDVVVSDLNLPDGTGWDLLRRLADGGCRPKLAIAMSGYGTEEDIAKSKAAGFHQHLVKPFSPAELETALEPARRKKRARTKR